MMRKMFIRISEHEYNLLQEHCHVRHVSVSEFICSLIRVHIISAEPEYSEDLILKIAERSRHNPMYIEKVINRYPGNWRMQAQAIFAPSKARMALATCLEDVAAFNDPDYTKLAVTVALATGFNPIRIERILKRYPFNIELQVLELFRALEPRIDDLEGVSLKIGDSRNTYKLTSLDELAQQVRIDIQQVLPTEFDVARLTKMIEEEQDDLPSDKDFDEWLQQETEEGEENE